MYHEGANREWHISLPVPTESRHDEQDERDDTTAMYLGCMLSDACERLTICYTCAKSGIPRWTEGNKGP